MPVWVFSDVNRLSRAQEPTLYLGLWERILSNSSTVTWPLQGRGRQPPAGRALRLIFEGLASTEPVARTLECRSLGVQHPSRPC